MTRVASLYISWYSVLPLLEQHPSSGCPYPGKEKFTKQCVYRGGFIKPGVHCGGFAKCVTSLLEPRLSP